MLKKNKMNHICNVSEHQLTTFNHTLPRILQFLWEHPWIFTYQNVAPGAYLCFYSTASKYYFGTGWIVYESHSSCPTLCNSMDCSPPGNSIHGIFQTRILEWVAISICRGSSQPRDQTQVSPIAGRLFTIWATKEARLDYLYLRSSYKWNHKATVIKITTVLAQNQTYRSMKQNREPTVN